MKKNKLPLFVLATAITVFAMPGCGLLDWQNGDPTSGGGTSGGNHGGNGGHGHDSSGNHHGGGNGGGNNGGGNGGGGTAGGDSSITIDTTVVWDSNYYNDSLVWFDTVIDGVHFRLHR